MRDKKPLCIGMALVMGWLSRNGWRKEENSVEDVFSIQAYIDLAQRAEAAGLDFLFRPDTLFLAVEATKKEPGFSSLDPFLIMSAVAANTKDIGLIATSSTTFNPPYVVARQLQSLQWISNGRAGWNVVTAIDGHKNFGESTMLPSENRYQKATEFLDVVKKLWDSYPNDSLLLDKENGHFANTDAIAPIDHQGEHFSVEGPLNVPSHKHGRVALFQAGASEHGREFAANIADAVFAATPDMEAGIELKNDLAKRAEKAGRRAQDVKVLPGLSLFLAKDRQSAQALFNETHSNISREQRCDNVKQSIGLDISSLKDSDVITSDMIPNVSHQVRSKTHTELLRTYIQREQPTVEVLLQRPEVIGSSHWVVVGTPEDAYHEIVERAEAGAADGIIAVPGGSVESLELFLDEVLPRLTEAGWFDKEYQGNSLLDYLA
ncbi:NtaA/DmoA family FMN-dependent monooxygenase [Vibrio sonorensis]|uniref:NtaA/DmoA family FMN-dependent monooxygenase n=1 Tax=Vibrio sonorensis TaxID=1004316 RepID=UPI0008DA3E9F|nr:NtaA/DmoA family FMN-dependent monooxygenase [Vibrio sonorensis]